MEISPFAGAWEGDSVFDTGATYGLRARYDISRLFGVELNYGAVTTTMFQREQAQVATGEDKVISQFGTNAVLHLAYSELTPYLTTGVGFVTVDDTSFAVNAGGGAVYRFTDMIGARVDGRGWFSGDAPATDRYHHFEVTLGLTVQFMGSSDLDGDGISGVADLCPTQPEDKDSFKDSDGCPDEDNDEDGIKDTDDKCPLEAEDKDDDADEDGCPEDDAKATETETADEDASQAAPAAPAAAAPASDTEPAKSEGASSEETETGDEKDGEASSDEGTSEDEADESDDDSSGESGGDAEEEASPEGEQDSRLWLSNRARWT